MAQFMLLLYDNPADYAGLSPQDIQDVVKEYSAWAQKMGKEGRLAGGEKLGEDGGRILKKSKGGDVSISDGPFAETKEVLGGFFIIKAKDYDEAIETAQSCPHMKYGCKTVIRKVDSA